MSVTDSPPSSPSSVPREDGGFPRLGVFSAEWCTGPAINLGGSDYWRLAVPSSKLFENGWDVKFARNIAETPSGRLAIQEPGGEWLHDRDVIVIQRWMGEGTAERILRAREAGQVIVNEIDDHYWEFPEEHVSINSSDPKQNKLANRDHYRETVAASSLVTVSSQYLADELSDWGPPVRLVRNYIDGDFWPPTPPGDYVGWVGGLPWRGRDLELLRETVVPWLRERHQFFYHGGDVSRIDPTKVDMVQRLGYDRICARPLVQIFNYPKLWEPLRIALIPIDDTPFGRGKSWVKGLEASARRIPFIHSPHAEYEELGVGLCAKEPKDWVRHLEALEDPAFYEEQAAANRERAEELDISRHWQEWAVVFQEAFEVARAR